MLDFALKIEWGGKEYESENSGWSKKYADDIIQHANLTDSELQQYTTEIRNSILRNYFNGITYKGEPVERLAASTIRRKKHGKVFFQTGELYRSLLQQKIPKGYEIFFSSGRAQIAYWLQVGRKGLNSMPARPAFGIMKERADVILNSMISNFNFGK